MKSLIDFGKLKLEKIDKSLEKEILKGDDLPLKDVTGLSDYYKSEKKKKSKRANLQTRIQDVNSEIDTKMIIEALFRRFCNHRFVIDNAYIFQGWESDFITVTESMYVYEIESKMSKSDFNDDFKKEGKHSLLESADTSVQLPNKFYYACPRGMLPTYKIPSYAGLMEVSVVDGKLECNTVKEAPFIHKDDVFSGIKDSLLEKLAWRYRDITLESYDSK